MGSSLPLINSTTTEIISFFFVYLASLNRASWNAGNIVPSPGKLLGLPREETAESGQSDSHSKEPGVCWL